METINELKSYYTQKYNEKNLVFGEGVKNAKIMMVGEAPGENEVKQGRPFVGKAGKNLDEFLKAVSLLREELYITNVVKIRPVKESLKTGKFVNRPPSKEEIHDFLPLLIKEIETINPNLIVTLGNVPLKAVTNNSDMVIGDCHGKIINVNNRKIFPLYHPAAIIYNQALKDIYYADLENIKAYL